MRGWVLKCLRDPSLSARVTKVVPLLYKEGADAAIDRPAHVRAGSSIQLLPKKNALAVVQDDANFVALVDLDTLNVSSIALPAGQDGKRVFQKSTKKFKMDMEASVVSDDGALILFGSGSSSARERVAIVEMDGAPSVRVVDAHVLYEKLGALKEFSGSSLNIEGAARVGHVLRLFNRNNGEAKDGLVPVNATCDLDWNEFSAFITKGTACPEPKNVHQYDLGSINGVSLGFTDAAFVDSVVFFSGSAEDSPDAINDGPVTGSVVGWLNHSDNSGAWIEVTNSSDNSLYTGKIEGLVVLPGALRGFAIVDRDSTEIPSELLLLDLRFHRRK